MLRNLIRPEPRVGVQTFLDIYSRPSLSWTEIASLRERTSLPIVLKGVLHPDDARAAVDAGVDGIIVSNHGGRQIDGEISSLDALTDIAPVVDGRCKVLIDSGIYTGADVFKALALGATRCASVAAHVRVGDRRRDGARDVVANIIAELDLTLGLAGVTSVDEVNTDALRRI